MRMEFYTFIYRGSRPLIFGSGETNVMNGYLRNCDNVLSTVLIYSWKDIFEGLILKGKTKIGKLI